MNYRTFVAAQFAILAFFFSNIIPESGDILLPIVWIFDKRIVGGFIIVDVISNLRILPGAINTFTPLIRDHHLPISLLFWIPAVEIFVAIGILQAASFGAFFLKRTLRHRAPDVMNRLFHK